MPPHEPTDEAYENRWLRVARICLIALALLLLVAILGIVLFRGGSSEVVEATSAQPISSAASSDEQATVDFVPSLQSKVQAEPLVRHAPVEADFDEPPLIPGISLPIPSADFFDSAAPQPLPELGGKRPPPRFAANPLDEAVILAEDAKIPREHLPTGPTARLSLFGLQPADGRSFAFVIDHSNSMGDEGLGAIQAAAKELAARIHTLTDQQTFQVVAYNQAVVFLTDRELIPATAENKRKLVAFIADLAAFGQTEHYRGLMAALRMKPEVIFLLTDGGDPALDGGQMRTIRDQAAGRTSIHCVQFGRGQRSEMGSFLEKLASQNRGSFVYIDMNGR